MITLLQPIWLVLVIPLLAAWWVWKPASSFLHWLSLAILVLILLALSGLAVKLPSRHGTIVVVADRSLSMPAGVDAAEKEAIELIQRAMSADDRLAVVAFGQNTAIERSPQSGAFAGFTNQVGADASNLSDAIEKALALIPQNSTGKILVISDGRWTGKDPSGAAARAAARGVAIDYRSLQRSSANDLAISEIDAPVTVTPGEGFMMTAWVKSLLQQEIAFQLTRGGQVLAAGKTTVSSGLNRLTFRDVAGEPGAQGYLLKISGNGDDPIPENNSAKILVGVQGPRPLLVVTSSENSGLAKLISGGGLKIKTQTPDQCEWSFDALANYSGVLIENVPAEKIGGRGMETLAVWIAEAGAGLMMTGGKNSYGPGGYFKSPLEAVMPVSMELRQEHRKLALALVVAMDRSGSMAVPVAGGRTKMDLANLAAVQVLDLLTPMDEFGVVAVDSASHIIAELNSVEANKQLRNEILRVDSGGGGIFIYEALTTAAEMLLKAKSGARHIILFADAADSEEPGQYQELLRQCEGAGITVSVIGLGKPTDQDAHLLRDIAKRGNGQIFFTENAAELPRLFAQDTIVVARSTFLEDSTPIQFTGGMVTLTGKQFAGAPMIAPTIALSIGGYNLTYIRPNANLAVVTTDEYKAPVTAAWQAGGGRVLCYTGEADGPFTGALAGWKDAGEFFTSLARWTAGDANNLPGGMLLTQEVKNGVSVIQLHLDPEKTDRQVSSLPEPPQVTTLRGVSGAQPSSEKAEMHWVAADTLEVTVPLRGNETTLSAVDLPGFGRVALGPVALAYSPEFKPASSEEGQLALSRIAQATGGKERIELSGAWNDLPRQPRLIELTPWLLFLALMLLLVEILERQTGLVSSRVAPVIEKRRQPINQTKPLQVKTSAPEIVRGKTEEARAEESPPAEPAAILDAIQRARQKAEGRIRNRQD